MMRIRSLVVAPIAVLGMLAGGLLFAGVPAQAAGFNEINAFGPKGPSTGVFEEPESIAVEQSTGDVYVYDVAEEVGNVYKFNAEGEPVKFSGLPANEIESVGGEAEAVQVAVDNSASSHKGDIYIANTSEVSIYSPAGVKLETLTAEEEPCGVAVGANGEVYVGLFKGERVKKYEPSEISAKTSVSSLWNVRVDGLSPVCNITVDSGGNIYAAGYGSGGVEKYEASQFSPAEKAASGTVMDSNNASHTLAFDPASGDVYVDQESNIAIYNSSGALVEEFGTLSESYGVAVSDATGFAGDVYASSKQKEGEVLIFEPAAGVIKYPLTVATAGSGTGTVECEEEGSGSPGPCAAKYAEDAKLVLTEKAGPGSEFVKWEGACSGAGECKVTMSEAKSVTAVFSKTVLPMHLLSVTVTGEGEVAGGGIACTQGGGTCSVEVEETGEVTLKETPKAGSKFEEWSEGPCTGASSAECKVTVGGSEVKVAAKFGPISAVPLTVFVTGNGTVTGSGITNCGPLGGLGCAAEVEGEATLTPAADPGYVFAGWLGCKNAVGGICKVVVATPTEVIAVFLREGEKGASGTNGAAGEDPMITSFTGNEHGCGKGGIAVQVGSGTAVYVCNGPEGAKGANGSAGSNGSNGAEGPAGASGAAGEKGAGGVNGSSGAQGPVGATGPAGLTGQVELVTCKKVGKKQKCTTKLVSGTVKFTASGASAHVTLSRHGVVYAAGAARTAAHGRMSLRLVPVRRLKAGRYTLTLISGVGRHESILREAFTLR